MRYENAKFKINDMVHITNRGYVILGEILEGNIYAGAVINIGNTELRVQSIESVRSSNRNEVGMMIGPIEESLASKIKAFIGRAIIIS